jgi:hypothetical protein
MRVWLIGAHAAGTAALRQLQKNRTFSRCERYDPQSSR